MKNTVLVVGSSGLLGSHVLQAGPLTGYEVYGITRSDVTLSEKESRIDWLDMDKLISFVENLQPSVIVNCVAITSIERCEKDPIFSSRLNIEFVRDLANIARRYAIRLVQISTDAVFDGERGSYTETDWPSPINTYGRQKLSAESIAIGSGENALVLRTNFFGFGSAMKKTFLDVAESKLQQRNQTPGFIDAFASFLSVTEVARLVLDLAGSDTTGTIHLCGSEKVSKYEFLSNFAALSGYDPRLVIPVRTHQVLKEPRGRDLSMVSARAEGIIGTTPTPLQSLEAYLFQRGRLKSWPE